jgi:hypothetical protein
VTTIVPTTDGNLILETRPLKPGEVCRIEADGDATSQGWATLDVIGTRILFYRLGELLGLLPVDPGYSWARSGSQRLPTVRR